MEYMMRTLKLSTGLLFLALVLASSTTLAENKVYRWVDANGVVHYGERPNDQYASEEVTVNKPPANPASPYQAPVSRPAEQGEESTAGAGEPEVSYAQQRRDERAKKREEAAKKKRELAIHCQFHRQQVAKLEPMTRVMIQRNDGTVERMDDNERLSELNKSKEYVSKNCNE